MGKQRWPPWKTRTLYHLLACALTAIILTNFPEVYGHGRLIEPPSRASMWRYGFSTPPNYNDHELYCGGFTKQWQVNGGKCGICGDPWDAPQPRPHEAGGKYGQGIIVRKYKAGSAFTIRIEVTANHRGYFEFRLCPNNNPKRAVSQQCLDKYVLRRARTTVKEHPDEVFHETRFYPGTENKVYETRYMLPRDLTCTQCVLQWKYIAGNNWGMCANGTGAVGCGPQEEFRACADIAIQDSSGGSEEKLPEDRTTHRTTTAILESTSITSSTEKVEETTPSDHENEIPQDTPEEAKAEHRRVVFGSSVLAFSLAFVLLFLLLLYFYYYHAKEALQNQLSKTHFRTRSSQFWAEFKSKIKAPCKHKVPEADIKPPVPPPRTKKLSIGFKGVPENLV